MTRLLRLIAHRLGLELVDRQAWDDMHYALGRLDEAFQPFGDQPAYRVPLVSRAHVTMAVALRGSPRPVKVAAVMPGPPEWFGGETIPKEAP